MQKEFSDLKWNKINVIVQNTKSDPLGTNFCCKKKLQVTAKEKNFEYINHITMNH